MDEKKTYKLPPEWIERIFTRFEAIFKDQWRTETSKAWRLDMMKLQWGGGLYGLTGEEIRKAIQDCTRLTKIPTPMEFYKYAKSYIPPPPPKPEKPYCDPAVSKHYINAIKEKLNGNRTGSTSNATVSNISK